MFLSLCHLIVLFFLLLDAPGALPAFVSLLKHLPEKERQHVILRECILALVALMILISIGMSIFNFLRISMHTFSLAGGIMLFLIGIRMTIAEPIHPNQPTTHAVTPIFFPLAFPIITGPAITTTMIGYLSSSPYPSWMLLIALLCAWTLSTLVLLTSRLIHQLLGNQGLFALERCFGIVLLFMASNLILRGWMATFT